MIVRDWRMKMRMRVWFGRRDAVMFVLMMLVVKMHVFMKDRFVLVQMRMPFANQ